MVRDLCAFGGCRCGSGSGIRKLLLLPVKVSCRGLCWRWTNCPDGVLAVAAAVGGGGCWASEQHSTAAALPGGLAPAVAVAMWMGWRNRAARAVAAVVQDRTGLLLLLLLASAAGRSCRRSMSIS